LIWSDSRKLCFIHIPKTGGTSITESYEPQMLFGDVLLGGVQFAEKLQPIYRERYGLHKHSGARHVISIVGEDRFKGQYSFAMLREPVERMVSFFKWLRRPDILPGLKEELRPLSQIAGFTEFAEVARASFYPQSIFVTDLAGNLAVDEVFPVDMMDYAVSSLSKYIGAPLKTRHGNKSENLHVEVSSEARGIIEDFYSADAKLYMTAKQRLAERMASVEPNAPL
jgi:hypothetical protein